MAELVGDDVGLREVARRAEAPRQLVEEARDRDRPCDRRDSRTGRSPLSAEPQADWTASRKRTTRVRSYRLPSSCCQTSCVSPATASTKSTIRSSSGVVWTGAAVSLTLDVRSAGAAAEQRQEVGAGGPAQHEQHQEAADADRHAAAHAACRSVPVRPRCCRDRLVTSASRLSPPPAPCRARAGHLQLEHQRSSVSAIALSVATGLN